MDRVVDLVEERVGFDRDGRRRRGGLSMVEEGHLRDDGGLGGGKEAMQSKEEF